jgi:hypothetical protein
MTVIIGVDPHKASHTAVAIGGDEREMAKGDGADDFERDPDYMEAMKEAEIQEQIYLSTLEPFEVEEYHRQQELANARRAAEERAGRGAKGMSTRSRQEMWRWILTLPFEMLGERPLWITLTYPGDWRTWVPDGRQFERHRRAFGEAWFRDFGERPLGLWTKEFQLKDGRHHLHLLVKGPDAMSESDYSGFQELTRIGNANVRKMGKWRGRWWTPPISEKFGGDTAVKMLESWSRITTDGQVENHKRRGVNVRAVFFARDSSVVMTMRRSALAAYMAGEAAKMGQKVPPLEFGTVGRYFGAFGEQAGFKPQVERIELPKDEWLQLNRRMTLLDGIRRRAKGRPPSERSKLRRAWQGLTVGGMSLEDYGRLLVWSHEAAVRRRAARRMLVGTEGGQQVASRPRGFAHKEAPQAHAQEEAQEDAQSNPLATAGSG